MEKLANYINGEYAAPQSGAYMDNFDPATGKVYCQLPDSDELDVVYAIQAANKTFQKWQKETTENRVALLNTIADVMEKRKDELAAAESKDVGKPLWLAKDVDIPRAILNFRFFASKIMAQTEISARKDNEAINYMVRQPLGVAGLISPWNLPLYLLTWKVAPAIACGNTVVAKPSEITPMTAYMMGEIFNEAGVPPGVINIVFGRGDTAGSALVQHPGVPLISFTGGTETGVKVQEMAAKYVKKVSLELGGKNANVVFKDADLNKAVPMTVRSSFMNSGQICLCGSRIYVQDEIYEEFKKEFVKQTLEIEVGAPSGNDTFMGPVVSQEHFKKVSSCIDQAVQEGGTLLTGKEPLNLPEENKEGYFIRPTIIDDLTDCSDLYQREIFGPVVTIRPFKYQHEAVKLANTSTYGLSASVWTQDITRGHKVAAQINAGTVWVNTWMNRDLRVPFGGAKGSGIGREGGDYSLDFYSSIKNICVKL